MYVCRIIFLFVLKPCIEGTNHFGNVPGSWLSQAKKTWSGRVEREL